MAVFHEIKAADLAVNPFNTIGNDWLLITAEKEEKVNTMTASWGALGIMWGKPTATVYIRKSRFTKEFVDAVSNFSINLCDPAKYRDAQKYFGTVSGRTEDKVAKQNFTVAHKEGIPYFEESDTVLLCRKLSCTTIDPSDFIDPTIENKWYADHDLHDMYICEITNVLKKSE
ncbi:MAG: flavin reductase [Eubacteriales bacterium]|nr:flavin reductase [Eubacteriales bacterium]